MVANCASGNNDLAERFSAKTRTVLTSELYRKNFPYVQLERKSKTRLWNIASGERQSFDVMSNVTGQHAHFIIIDDPINPAMSMPDKGLAAVNEWMDATINAYNADSLHKQASNGQLRKSDAGCLECQSAVRSSELPMRSCFIYRHWRRRSSSCRI